jgi:hypothetical protein
MEAFGKLQFSRIFTKMTSFSYFMIEILNPYLHLLACSCRGTNNFVGDRTKGAACVGCLFCCLPGCFILCFPLDERDAYKVKEGVYDAGGKLIGPAGQAKFIPKQKMSR